MMCWRRLLVIIDDLGTLAVQREIDQFRREISQIDDIEIARQMYLHHIGRVFVTLGIFEQTLIHAIRMPWKMELPLKGNPESRWTLFQARDEFLRDSTLGSMIKVLEKNECLDADLSYLRYVKRHRDLFVHRFFENHIWPGEINDMFSVSASVRTLKFLEITFGRATDRLWGILVRNNFLQRQKFTDGSYLIINNDPFGGPDD